MSKTSRWFGAAVAACALGAVGCGSEAESGTQTSGATASAKPVKMVLSNNFMGNEWRPQMVNIAEHVATSDKYQDKIDFEVKLSDAAPAAQIQSLQAIIRDEPDVILVDAASPTALNPTLQQACAAGITVVSFDQLVTAPCAYKIGGDYAGAAEDMLHWLAAQLGGKGKILMDKGLAGVQLSADMVETWNRMLEDEYPDIEVVGSYNSQFTEAVEQQAVASMLAQHPEVDGVLSQVSCSAVIAGFEKAGREPVPVGCNAYNRGQIACVDEDVPCFIYPTPANIGGLAVERAYEMVAEGREQPQEETVRGANMLSPKGEIDFPNAHPVESLKAGENYFPDESPALSTPLSFEGWEITPAIALGD